jgi:HEAT repeat protein
MPDLAAAILARIFDALPEVRHAALEAVGKLAHRGALGFPGAMGDVIRSTRDDSELVRAEAAVATALLPADPAHPALPVLSALLEDPSPRVRREAAAALGDLGDRNAARALNDHLADPDEETRFEAAFALASMRDSRGLDALLAALGSHPRRLDACEALKRLGNKDAVPELRRATRGFFVTWAERLTLWATLYALGERDAAEPILQRTRAWNREERALALGFLGIHRVIEGTAVLEKVAQDAKDALQGTAVRALGDLGQTALAVTLERVANDPRTPADVRVDAVHALARSGGVREALERLSRSELPEVASAAAAMTAR